MLPPIFLPVAVINKLPPAGWLKTTEIYAHTVLEAKSLKSRCWHSHLPLKVPGADLSLLLHPGFCSVAASLCLCLCLHTAFYFLCVLSLGVWEMHMSLDLGLNQVIQKSLLSRSLIMSTKTLFTNKVTLTIPRVRMWTRILGDLYPTHSIPSFAWNSNHHYIIFFKSSSEDMYDF